MMNKKSRRGIILALILGLLLALGSVTSYADTVKSENATKIPIFVYHRFCTPEKYEEITSSQSLTVTTEKLEEQMKFLHDNGYTTISADEFEAWYDGKLVLPRKTVMITIDDGWYSSVKYALPIFEKYNIKSTVFLIGNRTEEVTNTTEGEENQHSIGWDLVDKIQKEHPLFDIQSHGYDLHKYRPDAPIGKVSKFSWQECYDDLRTQSELFGFSYLAYPFGTYTDTLIDAIKNEGSIKMAFTYGNNKYATRDQDRYKIERIKISGMKGLKDFKKWLDEGEPVLESLQADYCNDTYDKVDNTLTFKSADGEKYIIMRKSFFLSGWKDVDVIQAEGEETSWVDKDIDIGKKYRYSVRRILTEDGDITTCTPYNTKGLKMLTKHVVPHVEYYNRTAEITFTRNILVSGYRIYRKSPRTEYLFLVDKNQRKKPTIRYTDVYKKTQDIGDVASKITFNHFIDPSRNNLVYSARPFIKYDDDSISLGPMLPDGDFNITEPNIVSVTKDENNLATYKIGVCPNASEYYLYSGKANNKGEVEWRKVGETSESGNGATITATAIVDDDDCFAAQAVFVKNGEVLYSEIESSYTTKYRKYQDTKMLVIGASGAYGCPYKKKKFRFIYSYPYRMADMLGAELTTPTIPGATYSTDGEGRTHLLEAVVEKVEQGKTISKNAYSMDVLDRNLNHYNLTDFDIVLIAAGGNDYNVDLEPGDATSTDTKTFAGGVNAIMDKLINANKQRVARGNRPMAIVMIGTTYSNRRGNFTELNNRYETPNLAGYTLMDFENVFHDIYERNLADGVNICYLGSEDYLNADNCSTATTDNLHMTRITNGKFGAYLAKSFDELGMIK